MSYTTLPIPPGFHHSGTPLQTGARWRDGSLVRWEDGAMMPVGGWRERHDTSPGDPVRGSRSWVDNAGDRWLAGGTYQGLYIWDLAGVLHDITPTGLTSGLAHSLLNQGYGSGVYGAETYGTPRQDSTTYSDATTWSLDTWGEWLVGVSDADGVLYRWTLDTAQRAEAISGAPTSCTGLVTTEQRHLMALGAAGNPRLVQWSDMADLTQWTPTDTTEAGKIQLETQGRIMCGIRAQGSTLILTDQDAHEMAYIGKPFVFSRQRVGTSCGVISRRAAAQAQSGVYWMGKHGFYRFTGGVVEEIPCPVSDYVYSRLNTSQSSKVYAYSNGRHGEVWWIYPSGSECDSYVAYSYMSGHWMIGEMHRTSGVQEGTFRNPVMFDAQGKPYDHEVDYDYPGNASPPYAETGLIPMSDQGTATLLEMIPDERTRGQVETSFVTRFHPNGESYEHGPYQSDLPTNPRFTSRYASMIVRATGMTDWRWGVPNLRVAQRGRR